MEGYCGWNALEILLPLSNYRSSNIVQHSMHLKLTFRFDWIYPMITALLDEQSIENTLQKTDNRTASKTIK